MAGNFIEHRDSGYYLAGSRVPIDRIVREYRDGEEPETIQSHYPTLNLEQVNLVELARQVAAEIEQTSDHHEIVVKSEVQ